MTDKKKLFIVHEASRSGAPILVLTFLRWLKKQGQTFDVLILVNGPLRGEFEALCTTFMAEEISGRLNPLGRMRHKLLKPDHRYWIGKGSSKLVFRGYDIVYGNSIVCLEWMQEFKQKSRARCVCAVHELTLVLDTYRPKAYITQALGTLDAVVAGSQTVADNLIANYAIDASKISVVHAFVDKDVRLVKSKAQLRKELGLEDGVPVIGGAGTPELRKGTDMIVPLAAALRRRHPAFNFKLLWLGGYPSEQVIRCFQSDASKLGLSDHVTFLEYSPSANDFINLLDVFILPSREDPFPLVALTAATLAKPIVAFEQGGGMVELLSHGAGAVVPFLDIDKFADAVHRLATDPALAAHLGRTVAARLNEKFDSEAESMSLWSAIQAGA